MKLRITTTIALAVILCSVAASAQFGQQSPRNAGPDMDNRRISDRLGLSDEQTTEIRAIVKQFRADVKEVVKSEPARQEKKEHVQELKENARQDLMAVLTPDQAERVEGTRWLDRLLSLSHHKGMRLAQALRRLDLSEDQKARIKNILHQSRQEIRQIKQDESLDRQAAKTAIMEVRKQTLGDIKSVLTVDQLRKLERVLQNRNRPRPRFR